MRLLNPAELAAGWAPSPELAGNGSPTRPLLAIDLASATALSDRDLRAAADAVRAALPVVVGVSTAPPDTRLAPLTDALALTLVAEDVSDSRPELVPVGDVDAALNVLATAVSAAPRAAMTLVQVLRQTEVLDVRTGLAAEAAAYSMLLAGGEFAAWLNRRGVPRTATPATRGPVAIERDGDGYSIVLDRPERRNAMDAKMRDALVDALDLAVAAPEVTVVVSGRGQDFCSGGDIDEFGSASEVVDAYLIRLERHPGWLLHSLGERAVVHVHGACIGAGIEMPSLAHRIVSAADAVFALPEVGMGIIPGAGGTVGIPRRIGRWRTAWWALTGARIDVLTAHAWGLVDEVGAG